MKSEEDQVPEFVLFGGPLHGLGQRLGLVRGTNTIRLGLVLGFVTWGVLVFLAFLQGTVHNLFSLHVIGGHVRLLIAIPLLFVCESWVAPVMADFIRNIIDSGVVPESEYPALAAGIRRVDRLADYWLAEIFIFLVVGVLPILETIGYLPGNTGNAASIIAQSGGKWNLVNTWYLLVCLPLFRFLILRWLWHLGLWAYFLNRIKKLNLILIPTHSGGTAGLGYVQVVHEHFMPLAFAISAVCSASLAENIVSGTMPFESLYGMILVVFLLNAVLFIAPLLTFSCKLWECRSAGLNRYMVMGYKYVSAFDRKWLQDIDAQGEPQLGTSDLQSLADLSNSLAVVIGMRWIPAGSRLLLCLATAVIVPLLPLFLLKYPISDLSMKLFQSLSGL